MALPMRDPGVDDPLELEVRELTDLLRHADSFDGLRGALAERGVIASETILAGLIESEDESRFGVLLVATGECILFEANRADSFTRWERVDDIASLKDRFRAVSVGRSLQRLGRIA
jgi:hypothetical protein